MKINPKAVPKRDIETDIPKCFSCLFSFFKKDSKINAKNILKSKETYERFVDNIIF